MRTTGFSLSRESFWQACLAICKICLKEIILLVPIVAVTSLLFWLAIPLMTENIGGLGQRYLADSLQTAQGVKAWWQGAATGQRALEASNGIGYILALWAMLGWLSLRLAAFGRGRMTGALGVIGLSGLSAAVIEAYGINVQIWLGVSTAAFIGVLALGLRALFFPQRRSTGSQLILAQIHGGWVWSLWILLTGLGVLWLTDLAARGPHKLMLIGLHQLDALWLASMLMLPFMIWSHHSVLKGMLWLREIWRTPRGPLVMKTAFIVVLLFCIWLGRYASFGQQHGYPHQSAELIRVLIALSLAWLMSRYAEWGADASSRATATGLAFMLLLGVISSLIISGDLGPVLAMLLGGLPLLLAIMMPSQSGNKTGVRLIFAIVCLLGLLFLVQAVLMKWLPESAFAPQRLVERAQSILTPYDARLDYAAQIGWLLDAASSKGFGLASAPWCGAMPMLGLGSCTSTSGVPVQFGSDYAYIGLAALWGRYAAVCITSLTALMFVALAFISLPKRTSQHAALKAPALLHAWIVVAFSSLALGQLAVSVAGNIGAIQLSGITQPLLGMGSVSLCAAAAWIGFSLGGHTDNGLMPIGGEPQQVRDEPRSWVTRAVMSMLIGVLVLVAGLITWAVQSEVPVKDKLISQQVEHGLALLACQQSGDANLKAAACAKLHNQWPTIAGEKKSGRCQKLLVQLPQILDSISKLGKVQVSLLASASCSEIDALDAVSRWAREQGEGALLRMLNTPARLHSARLAVINPYRVPGCLEFAHKTQSTYLGDANDQALCGPDSLTRLGKLIPGVDTLDHALSRATRATRESDNTSQGETIDHQQTQQRDITVPAWARFLTMDNWLQRRLPIHSSSTTVLGQGNHLGLSITVPIQSTVQGIADCYTGNSLDPSCESGGGAMLEGARARMMGILVVDAKTGGIEAAASAHSPCYSAQHNGQMIGDCLRLPSAPDSNDWMLANHGLNGVAMLGSLDKMPMSLGLVHVGSPLGRDQARMDMAIGHSETEMFIDDVMCVDQDFSPTCIKSRLTAIATAANDIGWQTHCKQGDKQCGKINLLQGSATSLNYSVPAARWMNNPLHVTQSLAESVNPGGRGFIREAIAACYNHGSEHRWRHCKGEALVQVLAELFGQGNATSTPVGIAQGLYSIVRRAQSDALSNSAQELTLLGREQNTIRSGQQSDPAAQAVLHAMGNTILTGGTANSACLRVEAILGHQTPGQKPRIDCRQPNEWVLSGKTGTPLFPHDTLTFMQREQHCQSVANQPDSPAKRYEQVRCQVPPVKWFASVVGQKQLDGRIDWQKIIIVLAERNWNASTGLIDSPLDRGSPNVAAEVALLAANRLIENTTTKGK